MQWKKGKQGPILDENAFIKIFNSLLSVFSESSSSLLNGVGSIFTQQYSSELNPHIAKQKYSPIGDKPAVVMFIGKEKVQLDVYPDQEDRLEIKPKSDFSYNDRIVFTFREASDSRRFQNSTSSERMNFVDRCWTEMVNKYISETKLMEFERLTKEVNGYERSFNMLNNILTPLERNFNDLVVPAYRLLNPDDSFAPSYTVLLQKYLNRAVKGQLLLEVINRTIQHIHDHPKTYLKKLDALSLEQRTHYLFETLHIQHIMKIMKYRLPFLNTNQSIFSTIYEKMGETTSLRYGRKTVKIQHSPKKEPVWVVWLTYNKKVPFPSSEYREAPPQSSNQSEQKLIGIDNHHKKLTIRLSTFCDILANTEYDEKVDYRVFRLNKTIIPLVERYLKESNMQESRKSAIRRAVNRAVEASAKYL